MTPEVSGGGQACRARARLPPPGSRPDGAAPARRADTRGAASGATGAAGGASLARCGRRQNSLCPFLAAAAPRSPLHADEATPGAPSLSPPAASGRAGAPAGSDGAGRTGGGPGVGSGSGLRAEHRGASVAVQGAWRTRSGGGGMTLGGRAAGTRRGRPPAKAKLPPSRSVGVQSAAFLAASASGPRDRSAAGSLKGASRRRWGLGRQLALRRPLIVVSGWGLGSRPAGLTPSSLRLRSPRWSLLGEGLATASELRVWRDPPRPGASLAPAM